MYGLGFQMFLFTVFKSAFGSTSTLGFLFFDRRTRIIKGRSLLSRVFSQLPTIVPAFLSILFLVSELSDRVSFNQLEFSLISTSQDVDLFSNMKSMTNLHRSVLQKNFTHVNFLKPWLRSYQDRSPLFHPFSICFIYLRNKCGYLMYLWLMSVYVFYCLFLFYIFYFLCVKCLCISVL